MFKRLTKKRQEVIHLELSLLHSLHFSDQEKQNTDLPFGIQYLDRGNLLIVKKPIFKAFTKTRNGTERDGTNKRRNITEQIIMEYGTKTEQTECEKTEQAERNGTEYYGIRNTDGTFGLQMVGTIRNTIIR